jgi:sulfate adenylyltransferase
MENHKDEKPLFISGKEVRRCLMAGEPVDPRVMRQSTAAILSAAMAGKSGVRG